MIIEPFDTPESPRAVKMKKYVLLVLLPLLFLTAWLSRAPLTRPLEYRAVLAHAHYNDPPFYEAAVFVNTLDTELTFTRPTTGTFEIDASEPLFDFSDTYIQVSIYNDGVLTRETVEAAPIDDDTIQFLHYQETAAGVLELSNGLLGGHYYGTAFYVLILVYP